VEDKAGNPRLVVVGTIRRAVGLKGNVLIAATGDDPGRFSPGRELWIGGDPPRGVRIRETRQSGPGYVVAFDGIETVEEAQELRGAVLLVPPEDLPPLPEGTYYHHQVVGLEVVDAEGVSLGRVESILETGSNDVYCVGKGKEEVLIPAIREYIERVDLPAGRILLAVRRSRLGGDDSPV
jgi:16S rRNA processing protein RimM